jgi:hypothetical protein
MKMTNKLRFLVVCILLLHGTTFSVMGQSSVPQGITYQGLARNSMGNIMTSAPVSLKFSVYTPSVSGTLEWEETHSVVTNSQGILFAVIGQGTTTGAGSISSFSQISWGTGPRFIKVAMDETGGMSFVTIDTIQFWAVPYAMHAQEAGSLASGMRISQLSDVDTLGIFSGSVLKWNGTYWYPGTDNNSDTAMYSLSSGHASVSDTALYAVNVLSSVDTVPFSYASDSAQFSAAAGNAVNAMTSDYCDTAIYALSSGVTGTYWKLAGNSGTAPGTDFLGTTDASDLVMKTNNVERLRIKSSGKVGIGTSAPAANLHIVGTDGVVAEGTFGMGALPVSGAGTRMLWHPRKSSFRAGTVTGTQWDDVNMGNYSCAAGYNTRASGDYSTVFGSTSVASGMYSFATCEQSTASGISSVAMGSVCLASGPYSIGIGRGVTATDSSSVSIGYHSTSTAKYALAFGYQTRASGPYSMALGYYANANGKTGSFVYADASSTAYTLATSDNQFMVRASGGYLFYTNTAMTTGVSIPAGGGSWASVSDKHKKENFKKVSSEMLLAKVDELEVSSWNYRTQAAGIRHIGPMAQDLYRLFGYGESDTTITNVDMDGINLVAIQALSAKIQTLEKKADELEQLKLLLAKLSDENELLEKRIREMELQKGQIITARK